MTNHLRLPLIALLMCLSSVACAQSLFKCKQAGGAYSYQSDPCPPSSTQQVLQADGLGNMKAVPTPARGTSHNGAPPTQPAKPTLREADIDNAKQDSDLTSAPTHKQASGDAEVDSSASIEPTAKASSGSAARALAISGLILFLVTGTCYLFAKGFFGDAIRNFFSNVVNSVLGLPLDDMEYSDLAIQRPILLWGTMILGLLMLLAGIMLAE